RYPVFPVFGKGDYRLQPVFVEDLAEIAIEAGGKAESMVMDAVGPEIYTFDGLVKLIAEKIGSWTTIVHINPDLALFLSGMVGSMVGDVLLTRDEVTGLMAGMLVSDRLPAGRTRLSEWLDRNANRVGKEYASELQRHYR
ncbi:MAG TPA: epimerase, partial [Geobacteraceae bacterium]|nr:epimerase [Geobacteraceae bacterium]